MIDIGANLTNPSFTDDREEVVAAAHAAGVTKIVITGTNIAESEAAVAIADGQTLFATTGVHPHDADAVGQNWHEELDALALSEHVVAIGETGLDFYRGYSERPQQEAIFAAQLELATRLEMPVFVHDRESEGRTFAILNEFKDALPDIVVHCFTGTDADLDKYLESGFYVGVTGWICDERRGADLRRQVKRIPDDKLLIETDSPYLLPRTMRPRPKSRRNVPANLPWVAQEVARCRDQSIAHIEETTHRNAERFFRLPF